MLSFKKFLKESYRLIENIELAAADVHAAWMARPGNAKSDWNAHLHVPYEDLPEEEKEKDRLHVRMIGDIAQTHGLDPSNPEHHDEIINHFGSAAHEEWRRGFEAKSGVGAPRMKKTADGEVNINVPWAELHPDYKKENIAAAQAAIAAHTTHMR